LIGLRFIFLGLVGDLLEFLQEINNAALSHLLWFQGSAFCVNRVRLEFTALFHARRGMLNIAVSSLFVQECENTLDLAGIGLVSCAGCFRSMVLGRVDGSAGRLVIGLASPSISSSMIAVASSFGSFL